ncbi:hypothetical protein CDD82_4326 [Ophiocordyceps australis]|uniref:Early meiotic induction protein 1 n=1 Tax=Ophiocordyceps australis TaxID=1399860 RepID=A0A2C5Z7B2_9HYPO|nr:hypothetical protein CDD82_4326 [Ophiocordyceps australis]
MGWLWTRSPSPPSDPKAQAPPAKKSQDDNDTDRVIKEFLEATSTPSPLADAHDGSLADAHDGSLADAHDGSSPRLLHPVAEAILPSEMSCRQAFDYAFSCLRAGSQFNSIYRYGSLRQCNHLWDNFWFCMRIRTSSPELKANMVRNRFREMEQQKYGPGKPSSEDIWQSRDEKVEPGSAFTHAMPDPSAVGDEEWQRMETERRRLIRQNLGFED